MLKHDDSRAIVGALTDAIAYQRKSRRLRSKAINRFYLSLIQDQKNRLKTSSLVDFVKNFLASSRKKQVILHPREWKNFPSVLFAQSIESTDRSSIVALNKWIGKSQSNQASLRLNKKIINQSSKRLLSIAVCYIKQINQFISSQDTTLTALSNNLKVISSDFCMLKKQILIGKSFELSHSYRGIHEQTNINQRHPCRRNLGHFCGKWHS